MQDKRRCRIKCGRTGSVNDEVMERNGNSFSMCRMKAVVRAVRMTMRHLSSCGRVSL